MCYEAFLQSNRLNSLVTKAFRRDLMDAAIDYSPWRQLSLGEDCFQSFPLFDKADSIYYLDQALYRYCKRENSITTSAKPHFYEMRKMLWEREDEYLSAWHIREKTREIVCQNRWNEVINYAIGSATAKPYSVFVKEMEHIRRDGWLSRAMENAHLPGRYRWYSMLLIQRQDMLLFIIMKAENRFIRKRKA